MRIFIKIILTAVVSILVYLFGLLPCYLLGIKLVEPIDYFCSFALGMLMWVPILAVIYFSYVFVCNIINKICSEFKLKSGSAKHK